MRFTATRKWPIGQCTRHAHAIVRAVTGQLHLTGVLFTSYFVNKTLFYILRNILLEISLFVIAICSREL